MVLSRFLRRIWNYFFAAQAVPPLTRSAFRKKMGLLFLIQAGIVIPSLLIGQKGFEEAWVNWIVVSSTFLVFAQGVFALALIAEGRFRRRLIDIYPELKTSRASLFELWLLLPLTGIPLLLFLLTAEGASNSTPSRAPILFRHGMWATCLIVFSAIILGPGYGIYLSVEAGKQFSVDRKISPPIEHTLSASSLAEISFCLFNPSTTFIFSELDEVKQITRARAPEFEILLHPSQIPWHARVNSPSKNLWIPSVLMKMSLVLMDAIQDATQKNQREDRTLASRTVKPLVPPPPQKWLGPLPSSTHRKLSVQNSIGVALDLLGSLLAVTEEAEKTPLPPFRMNPLSLLTPIGGFEVAYLSAVQLQIDFMGAIKLTPKLAEILDHIDQDVAKDPIENQKPDLEKAAWIRSRLQSSHSFRLHESMDSSYFGKKLKKAWRM